MCGTPHRSRTTRAGAARPSIASVPDTGGSDEGGACRAGLSHAAVETHKVNETHRIHVRALLFAPRLSDGYTISSWRSRTACWRNTITRSQRRGSYSRG